MESRTTFLVAHRLSMLRRADFVIVMESGCIVQRGTHDQLMHSEGYYRRAAEMQVADEESRRLLGTEAVS
jgi:ATP-binding cassette subfamily B protein